MLYEWNVMTNIFLQLVVLGRQLGASTDHFTKGYYKITVMSRLGMEGLIFYYFMISL